MKTDGTHTHNENMIMKTYILMPHQLIKLINSMEESPAWETDSH